MRIVLEAPQFDLELVADDTDDRSRGRYRFDSGLATGIILARHADGPHVALHLGDDDRSLKFDDWGLRGDVLCVAPHMNPIPPQGSRIHDYPLSTLDPDTYLLAIIMLRIVAVYYDRRRAGLA